MSDIRTYLVIALSALLVFAGGFYFGDAQPVTAQDGADSEEFQPPYEFHSTRDNVYVFNNRSGDTWRIEKKGHVAHFETGDERWPEWRYEDED